MQTASLTLNCRAREEHELTLVTDGVAAYVDTHLHGETNAVAHTPLGTALYFACPVADPESGETCGDPLVVLLADLEEPASPAVDADQRDVLDRFGAIIEPA